MNKKVVIVIQARLKSRRLPNKVLMKINGKTILHHLIVRLKMAKNVDEIVVATTANPDDRAIVRETKRIARSIKDKNISASTGPEEDVLLRILQAAEERGADIVVRVCGENIFTCPEEIDRMVKMMAEEKIDIVHNKRFDPDKKTVPLGMGCEVIDMWTLRKLDVLAKNMRHRSNVTFYAFENPELFNIKVLENKEFSIDARLTIDYKEDFILISKIIENVGENATTKQIINFLKKNPSLLLMNSRYIDNWNAPKL